MNRIYAGNSLKIPAPTAVVSAKKGSDASSAAKSTNSVSSHIGLNLEHINNNWEIAPFVPPYYNGKLVRWKEPEIIIHYIAYSQSAKSGFCSLFLVCFVQKINNASGGRALTKESTEHIVLKIGENNVHRLYVLLRLVFRA